MFVLTALMHRNGADCREYYQPDEKGPPVGVVFGWIDGKARAKHYETRAEAEADIPNWVAQSLKEYQSTGRQVDTIDFEVDLRKRISVDTYTPA